MTKRAWAGVTQCLPPRNFLVDEMFVKSLMQIVSNILTVMHDTYGGMEVWGGGFLNESPRVTLQVRNWCRHVRWRPHQSQSNCPYCIAMVSMCYALCDLDTVTDISCPVSILPYTTLAGEKLDRWAQSVIFCGFCNHQLWQGGYLCISG